MLQNLRRLWSLPGYLNDPNALYLHCEICSHGLFWRREAQMNTAIASFFNLDWANTNAICFVCDGCGYVHWFLPKR